MENSVGGPKFEIRPWKNQNTIKTADSSSLNHQPYTWFCVTRGRGVCKVIKMPPPQWLLIGWRICQFRLQMAETGQEIKHQAEKNMR